METWRRYYNEERPHGAIGNRSPILLQAMSAQPARQRDQRRKTLVLGGPKFDLADLPFGEDFFLVADIV